MSHVRPHRRSLVPTAILAISLASCVSWGCRNQSAAPPELAAPELVDQPSLVMPRNLIVPKQIDIRTNGAAPSTEWDTEQLNELAGDQLKELGSRLTKSDLMELDDLLAVGSVSNSLTPLDDAGTIFDDGHFSVRRINTQQDAANQALETQLRCLHQANDWSKTKFKIIRVRKDPQGSFSTVAHVHLSGRSSSTSSVEINSTWDIQWQMPDDAKPRLATVTNTSFEIATLSDSTLFNDITSKIIGETDVYSECILPGIGALRHRIEHRLGVYNLGHHGIAIGDVDGDGLPDAYVCQTGGVPNHLFIQNPDGSTTETANTSNVDYLDNTRAALLIDLDNDGDQDLVLTLSTGMLMLENTGRGQFQERARISTVKQGFSLSAADYNSDGLLDVYVCVYYGDDSTVSELPAPVPYFDATNGGANHLIVNEGNWRFRDGTEEAHLHEDNSRFSFASAWDDFDNDGDLDLLVVNDFGPNQLYRNTDGRFRNDATAVGLVDGAFGMSGSFGDFNRDGRSDIYVANMFSAAGNRVTTQDQFKPGVADEVRKKFLHLARGNSLFVSRGEKFEDVSVSSGVTLGRWSWGSLFADINNDGWEDLLVGNGYVTGKSKDDL